MIVLVLRCFPYVSTELNRIKYPLVYLKSLLGGWVKKLEGGSEKLRSCYEAQIRTLWCSHFVVGPRAFNWPDDNSSTECSTELLPVLLTFCLATNMSLVTIAMTPRQILRYENPDIAKNNYNTLLTETHTTMFVNNYTYC